MALKDKPIFDEDIETIEDLGLDEPPLYKVLLHNDDYTTMDFVVKLLMEVFHKNEDEAVKIMLHVHNNGVGVAGVYTKEIAETKVHISTQMAREHGFPLLVTMEKEEGD